MIEKIEQIYSKVKDLSYLKNKNENDYAEKYMKTRFNSDDEFLLRSFIKDVKNVHSSNIH